MTERDLAAGAPNDRYDVIVFPEGVISAGGGRGGRGGGAGASSNAALFANLDTFVQNGGEVLAFNGASTAMIDGLKLPVKNALAGVR